MGKNTGTWATFSAVTYLHRTKAGGQCSRNTGVLELAGRIIWQGLGDKGIVSDDPIP